MLPSLVGNAQVNEDVSRSAVIALVHGVQAEEPHYFGTGEVVAGVMFAGFAEVGHRAPPCVVILPTPNSRPLLRKARVRGLKKLPSRSWERGVPLL